MLARRRSIPYNLTVSRPNECVAGAAQGPSEQPYTWLANAGRGGAFLARKNERAQSVCDCPSSGVRNSHAHGFDRSAVLRHGLRLHLHEASSDKLKYLGGEPRNESSVGAAMWRVSE